MNQKKKAVELCMAIVILLAAGVLGRQGARLVHTSAAGASKTGCRVVIDVGHGGIDSGKVSATGILEKDVNLVIAKKLGALLEQADVEVIYTRERDQGLYQDSDSNKKVADLRNRCALIERVQPDCTVSIHQNSYSSEEVRGAQVFYYGQSQAGAALAEAIQQSLILRADPDNHRSSKANDSYYLLRRTVSPTVIVECGFLSCPQEAQQLISDGYQNRLAWAIHMGVLQFLNNAQPQAAIQ